MRLLGVNLMIVVGVAMALSYEGVVPRWAFVIMLVAMHVWIFTRMGVSAYNRKRLSKSK